MALAWFLQKKLYQKNWQKNLKIQVSFQDSAIYEGEESTLKEVIVNDKLLPIPRHMPNRRARCGRILRVRLPGGLRAGRSIRR